MRFSIFLLIFTLICGFSNAKEFRIDFSDEGMKLFKKKGLGKKTIYTNDKDEKGWFLKAEADSGATGLGTEIDKDLLKEMPFFKCYF